MSRYTEASGMMDFSESLKLFQRAVQVLINEVPILSLTYATIHVLINPWARCFPKSLQCIWCWNETILKAI